MMSGRCPFLPQAENEKERLREEEWRTDIPTIGGISYAEADSIVYYYSGDIG